MSATKLNQRNFMDQIIRYGYFAEQMPECFHSVDFANAWNGFIPLMRNKKCHTSPTTLSTYKNEISRRVLSLPNPEAFLRVANYMCKNWQMIKSATKSENSLSPISFILTYNSVNSEALNSENLREKYRTRSDYIKGIKQSIRVSLGYKVRLVVDIANFYNTIYTHSISWALCGKDDAKKYFRSKTPTSLKTTYDFADKLDNYIRRQKNDETSGIIIGPYTSRIFWEIILVAIDKELRQNGFCFTRYVDDYKFFFRSEAKAYESIAVIERILNTFNLNLNNSKTEVRLFPFEYTSAMRDLLTDSINKPNPIFEVLNTASQLYDNGEKGAYKYALKLISRKNIDEPSDVIIALLFNIMLLNPKYSKYVVAYIKKNINNISRERLEIIINNEMKACMENNLQQEMLQLIFMIRELKLPLSGYNMINIINSNNDFAIIIALDIWKNSKYAVKRNRTEAKHINEAISNLANSLNGETYNGERWILMHEAVVHSLLPLNFQSQAIAGNTFFQKLQDDNISFYRSLIEN